MAGYWNSSIFFSVSALQKHLVITVHGIGEHRPGATVDELGGAMQDHYQIEGETRSDERLLSEKKLADGMHEQFPCHSRDITSTNNSITLAEVYWSDLSPAPQGAISTLCDLLSVVLGLGYVALDNAEKNGGNLWPPIVWLVKAFVWSFYSFLAPINAMLFLGAIAIVADGHIVEIGTDDDQLRAGWFFLAQGLLAAAVSSFLWRRARRTFMARSFVRSLFWMGVLIFILSVVNLVSPGAISVEQCWPVERLNLPSMNPKESEHSWYNLESSPGLDCFVAFSVFSLAVTWLWLISILVLMVIGSCAYALRNMGLRASVEWILVIALLVLAIVSLSLNPNIMNALALCLSVALLLCQFKQDPRFSDLRYIYLSVCAAMLTFWMLFVVSLWLAFQTVVKGLNDNRDLLDEVFHRYTPQAISSLGYVATVFILLLVCGAVVAILRFWYRDTLALPGLPKSILGRVVLSPIANIALFLSVFLIAFGVAVNLLNVSDLTSLESIKSESKNGIVGTTDAFFSKVQAAALFSLPLLGVALYTYHEAVASVLGVVRDVIVYSTRTHLAPPKKGTASERNSDLSRYLFRERINSRFDVVYDYFTRRENYSSITVMSHSLGTVVAASQLVARPVIASDSTTAVATVKPMLVTMGSPIGHIYNHYFRQDFDFVVNMSSAAEPWHNIFRTDDFVGTSVKFDHATDWFVEEKPVKANGHSGYWRDVEVLEYLRAHLAFLR